MKAITRNTGILLLFAASAVRSNAQPATTSFSIEQTVATQGFAGEFCWVHARAGVVPETSPSPPQVIMTMQQLQLSGSDVFFALNEMRTTDLGASWSPPHQQQSFARIPFEFYGHRDLEVTVCDFTPKWHAHTGRLIGTGQTVVYENNACCLPQRLGVYRASTRRCQQLDATFECSRADTGMIMDACQRIPTPKKSTIIDCVV